MTNIGISQVFEKSSRGKKYEKVALSPNMKIVLFSGTNDCVSDIFADPDHAYYRVCNLF